MLVDVELVGQKAHHLSSLGIVGRHLLDLCEQATQQFVMLEQKFVGFLRAFLCSHWRRLRRVFNAR